HDGVVGADLRAVDRRSVRAPQVAHVPDAVDQLERAVLARDVLKLEANITARPAADEELRFVERDGIAAPHRVQDPEKGCMGRHEKLSIKSGWLENRSGNRHACRITERSREPQESARPLGGTKIRSWVWNCSVASDSFGAVGPCGTRCA